MHKSNVQLTMSHTGLGNLHEYALMVLFGNTHSFHLVQGLSITPNDIVSMDGTTLYPAYFWTHLKVPLTRLLHTFKLWDVVDVGVDVRKFGETLLESSYALADNDTLPGKLENWVETQFPVMSGNNLIVAEELNSNTAKRTVLNPNPDKISELPKVARAPQGIARSRKIRAAGVISLFEKLQFTNKYPFTYRIVEGRDCSQGHAMIFAKFADIFDYAEKDYLSNQMFPGLSNSLISKLSIVDREIFYYGNCYAGEEVEVYLSGNFEICDESELLDNIDFIPAAYLNVGFEAYQKNTKTLLASCVARKVLAVPMQDQEQIHDIHRIVLNSGKRAVIR